MQTKRSRFTVISTFLLLITSSAFSENGYDLWLRYVQVSDASLLEQYRSQATQIIVQGNSATITAAKSEMTKGLNGLLAGTIPSGSSITANGAIVIGTPSNSSIISELNLTLDPGSEAYKIFSTTSGGYSIIAVASSGDIGALYGTFHLLRLIQTGQPLSDLNISEKPRIKRRLLNHWDNLNGTIERGYAGSSLWKWSSLPGTVDKRYTDYARACASIGLNGTVLNNVNADVNILNSSYLSKVKALADIFRPYGIKVYLSANFAAPQKIGGQSTADPLNSGVKSWWAQKCNEIYNQIPDFGGFLVKANSEGQPGPKTYNRTHAEGANCLADAIAPHGGVVIWRAFVYDDAIDSDRMKRAYKEFKPLDGNFRSNVIVQAKNGPFDFQPREPVHPLFGGLTRTHVGGEFQITQEYLGQSIHLVYLAPYWKEVLDFDTYAKGAGSTVAKVLDGSVYNDTVSCLAGVANTGSDMNWCGHHFHQANWYAFGRLAWDHSLSSESISDEWTKMTWGWNTVMVNTIKKMLAGSREACVNYTGPLGLGGIFKYNDHYGPQPDFNGDATHPDWNSVYWHKADNAGVGYNRTTSGSNYVSQYFPENISKFNDMSTCPNEYLCWYFHVPWKQNLNTGRTFWDELCYRFFDGVHYVENMKNDQWPTLGTYIDNQRFSEVTQKLSTHYKDAVTWRDVCTQYFKGFSKLPIPAYIPTSAIGKQPQTAKYNNNPVCVYDLQGKLILKVVPKPGDHQLSYRKILKKMPQKMYLVRQEGRKPVNIMAGIGY
ncbi:MAG: alpha-glucuronidase [Fibrobacter sp.]|nr:alpha-glucuronidase [Fibrobacter sp.]